MQQQWFPTNITCYRGWKFTATENGWTDNLTALEWLQTVFLPGTIPEDPEAARLLILDGHKSHTTPEFMAQCFLNNVYVVYLPPHASHVLQPLDLSVFSVLKEAYRGCISRSAEFNNSTVIGKRLFLEGYHQARLKALTERTIKSGWRAAGLWPVNINKPLLSPLLLENRNFQQQTPATPCPIRVQVAFSPKNPGDISRSIQNSSLVVWKTPESAKDIKSQLGFYSRLTGSDSTQRLLFSKIQKRLGFQRPRTGNGLSTN